MMSKSNEYPPVIRVEGIEALPPIEERGKACLDAAVETQFEGHKNDLETLAKTELKNPPTNMPEADFDKEAGKKAIEKRAKKISKDRLLSAAKDELEIEARAAGTPLTASPAEVDIEKKAQSMAIEATARQDQAWYDNGFRSLDILLRNPAAADAQIASVLTATAKRESPRGIHSDEDLKGQLLRVLSGGHGERIERIFAAKENGELRTALRKATLLMSGREIGRRALLEASDVVRSEQEREIQEAIDALGKARTPEEQREAQKQIEDLGRRSEKILEAIATKDATRVGLDRFRLGARGILGFLKKYPRLTGIGGTFLVGGTAAALGTAIIGAIIAGSVLIAATFAVGKLIQQVASGGGGGGGGWNLFGSSGKSKPSGGGGGSGGHSSGH